MATLESAQAYCLQVSSETGLNLFDHLTDVVDRLLLERPDNAVDTLEQVSLDVKRLRVAQEDAHNSAPGPKMDAVTTSHRVAQAQLGRPLLGDDSELHDASGAAAPASLSQVDMPNLVLQAQRFQSCGVGLGVSESIRVLLALRLLVQREPVDRVRFWGKIFGRESNYYVAECEMSNAWQPDDSELDQEPDLHVASQPVDPDNEVNIDGDLEGAPAPSNHTRRPLPKSKYREPILPESEEFGVGVNKYVYFVTSTPSAAWTRLPMVTPQQIHSARQITRLLTGRLNAPVPAHPPFPGREAQLLRAQIARISAGTHLAPLGLCMFDEEDEEEDDAARTYWLEDDEWEPLTGDELADTRMENWTHIVQHVLEQGRTSWVSTRDEQEDMGEEEEDEDEGEVMGGEEEEEEEPEEGPMLLTAASDDEPLDGGRTSAWTVRRSSVLGSLVGGAANGEEFAPVVVSSNRWKGAHSYAVGGTREYANLYVGWGIKTRDGEYAPSTLSDEIATECAREMEECADPTVEEEDAARPEEEEEEEEEEEDEEESD